MQTKIISLQILTGYNTLNGRKWRKQTTVNTLPTSNRKVVETATKSMHMAHVYI